MNQIDMSQMPEGATHFNTTNKHWYKEFAPGVFGYWKEGKWVGSTARVGTHMVALSQTKAAEPKEDVIPTMEELMPIPAHITDPQAIAALEHVRERLYSTLVSAAEASLQEEEHCEDCACPDCGEPMVVAVTGEELMQALQTKGGMEALIASKVGGQPEPKMTEATAEDLSNLDAILAQVYKEYIDEPETSDDETAIRTILAATYCAMKDLGFHK